MEQKQTYFSPDEYVTRGMLVTVLHRMAGEPACTTSIPFTDVSSSQYYYTPVKWAYANGISTGTSGTTFEPEAYVTREDTLVFLWRYAYYCNYDTDIPTNSGVTSAADYSSISNYALDEVSWAFGNHIVSLDDSTPKLNPTDNLARKDLALWVTEFGNHVAGIVFGYDNYSFINDDPYFIDSTQNKYYMTDEDFELLCEFAEDQGSSSAQIAALGTRRVSEWGGSCFGMSMSAALDKQGKIGFNENLSAPVDSMYEVGVPINNLEILSRINFYQLSFSIPTVYGGMSYYPASDIAAGYEALLDAIEENGLVQLNYFYYTTNDNGEIETKGHAVVAYDYENNGVGYVVYIYDPNKTIPRSFIIEPDFSSSNLTSNELKYIRFESDFSVYNEIDYDGSNNTLGSGIAVEENHTVLALPLSQGNCTISNAEGEYIEYISGEGRFTGTMEIISIDETFYEIYLTVKNSSKFTLDAEIEAKGFLMGNAIAFAEVGGTGIKSISIQENGEVEFVGNEMEFEVFTDIFDDNSNMLGISASASQQVTLLNQNGTLRANGITGSAELVEFVGADIITSEMAATQAAGEVCITTSAQ